MTALVAITGRSGSGKSRVGQLYRSLGYAVCDADAVAREVLQPGSDCLPALCERFGADILDENGCVKRRLLADRAFATREGTAALTGITHPEIIRRILAQRDEAAAAGQKLFFADGAVIVGHALEKHCDRIILVETSDETAVRRICARDGISPEMAARRLAAQTKPEILRAAADYTIRNDGGEAALRLAALDVLRALSEERDE